MKKSVIIGIAAVIVLIGILGSFTITYDDEYKLIRRFGKIERVETESGIAFKIPFIEKADAIPKNIQLYDIAPSDVITMDKKTMVTDIYVLWHVTEPLKFAKNLNCSVINAEARINTAVYNSMKNVIGKMTQSEVIMARDGMLNDNIMKGIGSSIDQYGIELVSVETKRLDLPSDNKDAVYERMISERNQIAATYTAEGASESQIIKNNTDKDVSIMISNANAQAEKIIAEGEAEYMNTLKEAYSDAGKAEFYSFVRSLDAAKASLKGENKTLILDKNSPLAQIFVTK
ncbi:MAG: protease modulator HflC [Clostridiales bacterium]|nr:protease modulator HflC [Clostridiales bacterium]